MSDLRLLVVPGGTSPASAAMAHASLHKLAELYEERQADPDHPAPHTVVVIRDPELVPHRVCAQLRPHHVKPSHPSSTQSLPTASTTPLFSITSIWFWPPLVHLANRG